MNGGYVELSFSLSLSLSFSFFENAGRAAAGGKAENAENTNNAKKTLFEFGPLRVRE